MDKLQLAKIALLSMQRQPWEQGVAMQAFLECEEDRIVAAMAKEAAYRRMEDGRTAVFGGTHAVTDPCSNGEGILYTYRNTGDEELKGAFDGLLEWALHKAPRNADGIVYHMDNACSMWVDSLYMLPPFLACAGKYEEAVKQVLGYFKLLYNKEKHLMSHMWDDSAGEFLREDFWGVGNGWALAGTARVIAMLPEEMEGERRRLTDMERELLDGVLSCMREDGLFHDVLDRPDTFVETNCGQMTAYTIYRGIADGWLGREYLQAADKMRHAAESKVDAFGRVTDVCGAPRFDRPGCAPEGNAFYLLMESACEKLQRGEM